MTRVVDDIAFGAADGAAELASASREISVFRECDERDREIGDGEISKDVGDDPSLGCSAYRSDISERVT